ncbi:MAG: hypothetical protein KA765_00495 [Thermoflexales bacterium]|nr:hypothetical protein [Thermoflexales bacterium]
MCTYLPFNHKHSGLLSLFVAFVLLSTVSCSSPVKNTEIPPQATVQSIIIPTKPNPAADWSDRWVKGIPCKPPCWEGIIPGQTSASEAVKLLNASPIVFQAEMTSTTHLSDDGTVIWWWLSGIMRGGEAYYHARSPDQIIYAISPYFPRDFTLREIIQIYGEPSDIIARAYHNPDDGIASDVSIFYRSQGLVLGAGSGGKLSLNLDMTFDHVLFFAPTDEGLRVALAGSVDHPDWLTPWQGVKDFDFYCIDWEGGKVCHESP